MSEQPKQQSPQNVNISDSVLESVQIGGIAGRDLKLFQILGKVWLFNIFGTVQVPQASLDAAQPLSRDEHRWRKVLLSKVKQFWIDGVLAKSLHTKVLIELGLEDRSDNVFSPTEGFEEFSTNNLQNFPYGTSTTEVFEDIGDGRTLLILGEPGAGKTVTLLKLADSLIARTESDLSQPLPVVLNLSSWAKQRKSIEKWLAQELYETYAVSKSLGKVWIKNEQLILLLDGLDEVEAKHRNACVQALNQFIQDHGRTEIVICSRIHDYEALSNKLSLRSAIFVQPLTDEQIDKFLERSGESLVTLRSIVNQNSEIKAFASSPLILSIMSLAYQDSGWEDFPQPVSSEAFRQRLFDTYIRRMFQRRSNTRIYHQEQTSCWLIWLAQQMIQNSQTVFLIERMQPSSFQARFQRIRFRLESGLNGGLISGLISGLIFGLSEGLSGGLYGGLISGLIFGLIVTTVIGCLKKIKTVETLSFTRKAVIETLPIGLIIGFIYGLVYGLSGRLEADFINDRLSAGLFYELTSNLISEPNFRLISGLIFGIWYGTYFGIIIGILGGSRGPEIASEKKYRANQGVWRSAHHTMINGLLAGLVTGLDFGLSRGLIFALIGGIIGGGAACIQHFTLRFMLYRMGHIPWNYARFLNYATEHLFLQKVGGGYIFIHRMILEHFASMELEPLHGKVQPHYE